MLRSLHGGSAVPCSQVLTVLMHCCSSHAHK